uniref:28S ribosomal protein S17, mitochondrial (inferred by orthology to a C. elegans protein) n=1 Tax=Strongyloides venezuelensis TaxID=75913 RepID=A0A0K0F6H7_STRVS
MPSVIKTIIQQDILFGKVIGLSKIGLRQVPCVQVRCPQNEFNEYLKKYHVKGYDYWAVDTGNKVKIGDSVLIKTLSKEIERPSIEIKHQIDRIVFKFGNVVDPVTGKRVIESKFVDEIELEKKLVKTIVEESEEELPQGFAKLREVQKQKISEEHLKSTNI